MALRVLLTNNTLDYRAGSELYVRDAALGLLARGLLANHPLTGGGVIRTLPARGDVGVDEPTRVPAPIRTSGWTSMSAGL